MAIRGKPAAKPAAAAAASADENVITSIHVSRAMTVSMGEFNSIKVSVGVTGSDYDEVSAKVEELLGIELEKTGEQFQSVVGGAGGDFAATGDDEGAEEAGGEEGDEETLSPDDIRGMKRNEIEALITEHSLETDVSKFPKTAKGLDALREAVVEEAFGEGGEEAEAEEDAGEEGDGAEEGADDGDISLEDIAEMDRPTLIGLIKENELDIDPKKFPKLSALRDKVVEVVGEMMEAAEAEEGGEEAEAGEEGAEDFVPYTQEDLEELTPADLKAIWADWEVPGSYPAGPPVVAKKKAIAAILKFQDGE